MSDYIKEISPDSKKDNKTGIGLLGLIAIVFSSMVGGGIFNIAQNMAAAAGPGAVAISWIITGLGMIFLVLTFKILSDTRPHLNQGIYEYAQAGFGNYVGFNIAWGYWLCVGFGNVSFAVMLNDSFGAFFPVLLEHNWETLLFCWSVIWGMYFIVVNGVMTASLINTLMTILKFGAVIIIITLLLIYLDTDLLFSDIWAERAGGNLMQGISGQIMGTMLVTMFCFVGVEGAVVVSSYAKKNTDVGKASVMGFYFALIIYALISLLCFGVRTREELAGMEDPSIAYVLRSICGDWTYYFVIITVILSLFSAFIAWTLLCAQTPYGAAKNHVLPYQITKTNKHDVPYFGLILSSIFMSIFIILVCMAPNVYMAALNLTTLTVLPAYAFSGAFLWKESKGKNRIIGFLCTIYCIWCIFAGGPLLFLSTSILYALGIFFWYITWKQNNERNGKRAPFLSVREWWILVAIILASIISLVLICLGKISMN